MLGIMYLGKIVEIANSNITYKRPLHPYTKALLSAIPTTNPKAKIDRILLKGDVPSSIEPPSGCNFHNRCSYAKERCRSYEPKLVEIEHEHFVSCFLY
jgi:oligopeptide/dipeptide ABC transporter ATP-binding protein